MKRFSILKSYRQHNYAVLIIFCILVFISYITNISVSIKSYKEYIRLSNKLENVRSATADLLKYQSETKRLKEGVQKPYSREDLLENIISFCREHSLLIKNFPDSKRIVENNYPIITNEIEVQGSFSGIIELAYMVEQEKRLSSISSLVFDIEKDKNNHQPYLHVTLVLRNIETL